jgi:hypothetical protein
VTITSNVRNIVPHGMGRIRYTQLTSGPPGSELACSVAPPRQRLARKISSLRCPKPPHDPIRQRNPAHQS